MTISLSDAGKRYNREWIFRHFNYQFDAGKTYAITGANGSGKSTLLQVINGSMYANEGKINYTIDGKQCPAETVYKAISICAPYLELIEEMTLQEFLLFHQKFSPFLPTVDAEKIIALLGLEKATHKQIRYFSSGMKQRVKLAQAIFSDTKVVLLDEPCTNFDTEGVDLYHQLIQDFCKKRMVIVSSNDHHEYTFCSDILRMSDWK
ncbi:MAG: ATP-binding cassette domain-containing protein [Chitinophagaceae bacterium]|nr:ATP-binding cassette domain-containing protein [Chitinophagaceae bacterium]MCB0739654.1 ATP-binding cassette domain-containing protein [Chitinophagaceae bacterium]HQV06614.1 ATP-binding cassette domain-containing protein [Chitinophagaceae bacterium]